MADVLLQDLKGLTHRFASQASARLALARVTKMDRSGIGVAAISRWSGKTRRASAAVRPASKRVSTKRTIDAEVSGFSHEAGHSAGVGGAARNRSEEHTSELQ